VVALDRSKARVVAGEGEVDGVAGQALVGGDRREQFAYERGLAGDRVGRVERVTEAVAVPVDALAEPGAGHELGQALCAGGADGAGVPPGLLLELGGQQRGGDAGAGLGCLLNQGLVLGRDDAGAQDPWCGRGVGGQASTFAPDRSLLRPTTCSATSSPVAASSAASRRKPSGSTAERVATSSK